MRAMGLPDGTGVLRGASVEERKGLAKGLDRKPGIEQGVKDSRTVWHMLLGGWGYHWVMIRNHPCEGGWVLSTGPED